MYVVAYQQLILGLQYNPYFFIFLAFIYKQKHKEKQINYYTYDVMCHNWSNIQINIWQLICPSRELRNLVIDMVLATDMSYHFQQLKQVKTMIGMADRLVQSFLLIGSVTFLTRWWKFYKSAHL